MKTQSKILVAFILNLAFSIFEFIGGAITGSIAIVSDAIHDVGDAMSIGISYFLEKKSLLSMLTALAGTVVNVVLNFVMIPNHGAMGAAVATLISYLTVYAIRAYDTRFYIRFNLHTVKVIFNLAVLSVQTVVMIAELPYWRYMQVAFLAFMLIFNGKDIVKGVLYTLRQMNLKKS